MTLRPLQNEAIEVAVFGLSVAVMRMMAKTMGIIPGSTAAKPEKKSLLLLATEADTAHYTYWYFGSLPVTYRQASSSAGRRALREKVALLKGRILEQCPNAIVNTGPCVGEFAIYTNTPLTDSKKLGKGIEITQMRPKGGKDLSLSRLQTKQQAIAILDRLIMNKRNDSQWKLWPDGTLSDARKAVYADILDKFRSLQETKEYAGGLSEDKVIFTAHGDEIPISLVSIIAADIEKNPWLSPFRLERQSECWEQPSLLPMVLKCAWCGKYLEEKEPYEDKSETHGICQKCLNKYFPEKTLSLVTGQDKYKADITIHEDIHDAHRGELFGTLWAVNKSGKKIGRLDFSSYQDEVFIQWIEVPEQLRHQGIATALVDYLYRSNPDKKIVASNTTPEGAKFREAILDKPDLLPFTIPTNDLRRIADKYSWWAARLAEAVCPYGDVACVEREAKRLAETLRARWRN